MNSLTKYLQESILDSDTDVIKSTSDFIKIIDKSIAVFHKHLGKYPKAVYPRSVFDRTYQFKIDKDADVYSVAKTIDDELYEIRTKYHITYDKSNRSGSFIYNYQSKSGHSLTILIIAILEKSKTSTSSFIDISAYNGIYQGNEYTTDETLAKLFNEKMNAVFRKKTSRNLFHLQ